MKKILLLFLLGEFYDETQEVENGIDQREHSVHFRAFFRDKGENES